MSRNYGTSVWTNIYFGPNQISNITCLTQIVMLIIIIHAVNDLQTNMKLS